MLSVRNMAVIFTWVILVSCHILQADWTAPVDLSATGESANNPQVAVAQDGDAIAVWNRVNGTENIIQSSISAPCDNVWIPTPDPSALGLDSRYPKVAVDAIGNAVSIWRTDNGKDFVIQGAILTAGSNIWVPTTDLAAPGSISNQFEVSVNSSGFAVAVWGRFDGSDDVIQAATLAPGSTVWVPTTDLSASGNSGDSPDVAVGAAGNAVAVWAYSDGFSYTIQGATLSAGSSAWVPTTPLSGDYASRPRIDIDAAGNAVAVWERFDGSDVLIQGAALAAGSDVWVPTADLSVEGNSGSNPQISVDPFGNTVAVWEYYDGATDIIQGATLAANSSVWVPTTDLTASGTTAFAPKVAVDSLGNAIAVWEFDCCSNFSVQGARLVSGSNVWIPTKALSASGEDSFSPNVAVDSSGNAVAVWINGNGADNIVQTSKFLITSP